jgi:hypothetical protein
LSVIIHINQNLAAGLRSGAPEPDSFRTPRFDVPEEREMPAVWA